MIRFSFPDSEATVDQSDELVYLAFRDTAVRVMPMAQLWKERADVNRQDLDTIAFFHQSRPISEIRPLVQYFGAKDSKKIGQAELFVREDAVEHETNWRKYSAFRASKALADLRAFATNPIGELDLSADEVLVMPGQFLMQWFEAEADPEPGSLAEWLRDEDGQAAQARESAVERLAEERERIIETVPMLDATQLARLRGSRAREHRALAQRWRDSGELLGVRVGREFRYPEFQFDPRSGQIRPQMTGILARVRAGEDDPDGWRAMHWFFARAGTLGGERPWEVFPSSPDRVLMAAREEFFDADPVPELPS